MQLSVPSRWGRVELIGTGKCAIVIGTGKRAALLGDSTIAIDLIHDGRHVEFAIIVQLATQFSWGKQLKVEPAIIRNISATQMICFTFIKCL